MATAISEKMFHDIVGALGLNSARASIGGGHSNGFAEEAIPVAVDLLNQLGNLLTGKDAIVIFKLVFEGGKFLPLLRFLVFRGSLLKIL